MNNTQSSEGRTGLTIRKLAATVIVGLLTSCSPGEQIYTGKYEGNPKPPPALSRFSVGIPHAQPGPTQPGTMFLVQGSSQEFVCGTLHAFGSQLGVSAVTELKLLAESKQIALAGPGRFLKGASIASESYAATDLSCFPVIILDRNAKPLTVIPDPPLLGQQVWMYTVEQTDTDAPPRLFEANVELVTNHRIIIKFKTPVPLLTSGSPTVNSTGEIVGVMAFYFEKNGYGYGILVPGEQLHALVFGTAETQSN